jgi:hypothetical protein
MSLHLEEVKEVKEETKRSVERVRHELKRLEGVLRLEHEELLVLETLHKHCSAKDQSDA